MIRLRRNEKQNYYQIFDNRTGIAGRWSVNGDEPFWREDGPELLDISITDYCERECDFCYRQAGRQGIFMELSLYEEILRQAEETGVQQIALGGGNPNQHPDFIQFLKMGREHHITTSYTTNGQGMTEGIYRATKLYGGAMAVSWYSPYCDAIKVIEQCGKCGIPVNIHFMLHKEAVSEAMALLRSESIPWHYVSAIIFLNYKPVGQRRYECLKDNEELSIFLENAITFRKCKIGFDSCMISWLMAYKKQIAEESIDFCEAGRFSAFISEKGKMYPCSFMCGDEYGGDDIKEKGLLNIWKYGSVFCDIRERLSHPVRRKKQIYQCARCSDYSLCHGGCPEFKINRCEQEEHYV